MQQISTPFFLLCQYACSLSDDTYCFAVCRQLFKLNIETIEF